MDAMSRLLYYTDTGKKVIGVVSIDFGYRSTLINSGLDQPRAIAVDPGRGYVSYKVLRNNIIIMFTFFHVQLSILERLGTEVFHKQGKYGWKLYPSSGRHGSGPLAEWPHTGCYRSVRVKNV
jgi:hypothetical protein